MISQCEYPLRTPPRGTSPRAHAELTSSSRQHAKKGCEAQPPSINCCTSATATPTPRRTAPRVTWRRSRAIYDGAGTWKYFVLRRSFASTFMGARRVCARLPRPVGIGWWGLRCGDQARGDAERGSRRAARAFRSREYRKRSAERDQTSPRYIERG